jgi:beta-glucosidase
MKDEPKKKRIGALYLPTATRINHERPMELNPVTTIKPVLACGLIAGLLFTLSTSASETARFTVDQSTESQVDALLGKMTLGEKLGQLNQYSSSFDLTGPAPTSGRAQDRYDEIKNGLVGSMLNVLGSEATRRAQELAVENSRLRIPLIFGYDVIHGYRTMFPVPLAEAASWDLDAIEASARVAATEAAASGIHWTFGPMVDIARDARWGRVMEGAGEDPHLGAHVAVARVRGIQGDDLEAVDTIAACVKHYAAYGYAEAGRDYNTVDISDATLFDVVLPPFRAAVDAGAATLMSSFNEIAGIPATGSVRLQREILKNDWGFEGFVVSDWGSIGEMVPHGFAEDARSAARLGLEAGVDMDMESSAYVQHVAGLIDAGTLDPALVDDAVRRVLRVKFSLGLFDDPYRYSDAEREKAVVGAQSHLELARDVARKSIVLLKNDGGLLPLDAESGRIAVIGPLAADKDAPLGSWRAQAVTDSAVSLLEGVQAAVGSAVTVEHAEGAKLATGRRSFFYELEFNQNDTSGFAEATAIAEKADVVILALGEEAWQTGEGRSQVDITLKGLQQELLEAVYSANPNIVLVLMNGRPLAIGWAAENIPAIVEAWQLGSQAGHAIADVLFGSYNPSGKLPISFPHHVGQVPIYYGLKNTGRPTGTDMVFWSHYTDAPKTPLYPFGFGLSYTTFEFSDIELSGDELTSEGTLEISVTVKNTGSVAGAEVVQLYTRDLVGSRTRPVKELKGFEKVMLEPAESKRVAFTLRAADLAFYTAKNEWASEPGDFSVFVGSSSNDVMEAKFTLR